MEIWKNITDFHGYQVSNLGNVKSLDREVYHHNSPNRKAVKKGHIIKPFINKGGYKEVVLLKYNFISKCSVKIHKTVHRLVAEAFIDNPNNYNMINHKDENKLNNNVDNLEWCNHNYNVNYGTAIKRSAENRSRPIVSIIDGVKTIYKSSKIASNLHNVYVQAIRYRVRKGYYKYNFGQSDKVDIWRLADGDEIKLLKDNDFITIKNKD